MRALSEKELQAVWSLVDWRLGAQNGKLESAYLFCCKQIGELEHFMDHSDLAKNANLKTCAFFADLDEALNALYQARDRCGRLLLQREFDKARRKARKNESQKAA